ncbi:hypothetical protein SAMN04488096_10753 [Mesonia phycicola]|uniref:Uncharacterized protein n=1 Tax=Mesonia phycicola TaxID=579105 RepID=A0A1M6G082_9FLAO|nr:hypothetical protein [Mesonia phycicola]SHJ03363.1 hypothetical protein SAMN04488096_10753 [Mesonia phycicola]
MKRVFFKYFTTLFLLLVGVFAHAIEHQPKEVKNSFTLQDLIQTEQEELKSLINPEIFQYVKTPSSSEDSLHIKAIDDIEVEEYEWVSVKKIIERNRNLTALFYTLFSDYFFKEENNKILINKDIPNFPSVRPLYITFCVYRI